MTITQINTQINIGVPKCEKGIGDVILAPESPKLIAGVKCAPFPVWPDDRGARNGAAVDAGRARRAPGRASSQFAQHGAHADGARSENRDSGDRARRAVRSGGKKNSI